MNRRKFNLLGACSVVALSAGVVLPKTARAAVSANKAALLKTTLTPMGSERAGNADGSIPAWTGGATTVPAGWTSDQLVMPDMFADEKPLFTVDAANAAQYLNQLSDGIKMLMQKIGISINVYPTHRTAAAPQAIYDNIYQNALNAEPHPQGARFGFSGAFGGVPFPVPDDDDNQGAEIIWNHLTRWFGYNYNRTMSSFISTGGSIQLASTVGLQQHFDYYELNGSVASFDGILSKLRTSIFAPPPLYGQELIEYDYTNPHKYPAEIWQLLDGQGRVRKAPELAFDTPFPGSAGFGYFDELKGFFGSPEKYEWKSLGKLEMFIPYNNNGQFFKTPDKLFHPEYLNSNLVRWEKHRVWVVDATLAPGERNVVARRKFYIDEDTWMVTLVDEYDAQGKLWKVLCQYNEVRPDVPGTLAAGLLIMDLQASSYIYSLAPFNDPQLGSVLTTTDAPPQRFNPQDMAASAQY